MSLMVRRAICAIVAVGMVVYTVVALAVDGVGFLTRPFTDSVSGGVFGTDLMLELVLICIAIFLDARRRGRNPWGWIVVTALLGAVGSFGYLLARSFDPTAPPLVPRRPATAADRRDGGG